MSFPNMHLLYIDMHENAFQENTKKHFIPTSWKEISCSVTAKMQDTAVLIHREGKDFILFPVFDSIQ